MYVMLCGALCWVFVTTIIARLFAIARETVPASARRAQGVLLLALFALGAVLLFRPHEDIFGGQDGGAYLNFAARMARDPHLSYVDPLLAQTPPDTRDRFLYYGFERPYLSKYACGRVKDFDRAICSVWFQPAYPIVAALAGRLFGLRAVLYVVPFFGLLVALALFVLFRLLWPERLHGGIAAALFYIAAPLTVWHARHPRPEIIASFLLFSGMALLLRAWQNLEKKRRLDIVLGATCVAAAPFFHITAWMVAIPVHVLVALAILRGRSDFLLHPLIAFAGLAAFLSQLLWINDTYGLLRRYPWLVRHPIALTFLFAVAWLLLFAIAKRRRAETPGTSREKIIGWVTALALCCGYAVCAFLARLNPPSKEWPPVFHYMYRTDVRAVLNMISRPVAACVLLGWLLMALRRERGALERCALLWAAVPATLLIGNFYDFFVTRYLLVTFIPLSAIALASLAAHVPRTKPAALAVASLLLLSLVLYRRTHLLRVVEYRGFFSFIEQLARPIRAENGILLFEYPRIAAPFDLAFGVPTLALHNERDDSYESQERAWAEIMRRFPQRPAFFITPFQTPRSDQFDFTPLGSAAFQGAQLVQRRWELPTDVREWSVVLNVYSMRLAENRPQTPELTAAAPRVVELGEGNMGLRRFARTPQKPREVEVTPMGPDSVVEVIVPPDARKHLADEIVLFLVASENISDSYITLETAAGAQTAAVRRLVNEWHWARFPVRGEMSLLKADTASATPSQPSLDRPSVAMPLRIKSAARALLHDVQVVSADDAYSLLCGPEAPSRMRQRLQPFYTRWARQDGAICVPQPREGRGLLLVFHTAPDELSGPVRVEVTGIAGAEGMARWLPPGRWMWSVWPIESRPDQRARWLRFHCSETFDPAMRGYPPDLITHLGWVVIADDEPTINAFRE